MLNTILLIIIALGAGGTYYTLRKSHREIIRALESLDRKADEK